MRRRNRLIRHALLVALAAAGAGTLALLGAPTGRANDPPPAKILVKFQPGVDGSSAVIDKGDDPTATTKTKVIVVELKPGETADQGLADYVTTPDVAYAEPNVTYTGALDSPNDPSFSSQWALSQIQALGAWTLHPGSYSASGGAVVAVVDSGIDATNPDLADG